MVLPHHIFMEGFIYQIHGGIHHECESFLITHSWCDSFIKFMAGPTMNVKEGNNISPCSESI